HLGSELEEDERIAAVGDFERPRGEEETEEQKKKTFGFGCEICHRLKRSRQVGGDWWNELVTYLSGGLLYGSEVERPEWARQDKEAVRKVAYRPRVGRAPSARRQRVEELLLEGWEFKQIAGELGVSRGSTYWYAGQVYREHGVGSRR